MRITPAILTNDINQFRTLVQNYVAAGFNSIDIDICEADFVGSSTITVAHALKTLAEIDGKLIDISIGWDLMVAQPRPYVEILSHFAQTQGWSFRIYVHSNSNIDFIGTTTRLEDQLALAIDPDHTFQSVDFYRQFAEIQFMTVKPGQQGSEFQPAVLDQILKLRQLGYAGEIAIDGGVSIDSLPMLKAHPAFADLARVSVGSYFQTTSDIITARKNLEIALTN